jgi:hypothetical protein
MAASWRPSIECPGSGQVPQHRQVDGETSLGPPWPASPALGISLCRVSGNGRGNGTHARSGKGGDGRQWHMFTVSPDAPTNPVLYWTGHLESSSDTTTTTPPTSPGQAKNSGSSGLRFSMETAKGPFRLDLGDIFYAPNAAKDSSGRWILWGWLQERRRVGTYHYAGCLSCPRELRRAADGRLLQAPAPEVAALRRGVPFRLRDVPLHPEAVVPIEAIRCQRMDVELTLVRGAASAVGLLFRSYEAEAGGDAAIVFDWDRGTLEAVFDVPPGWKPAPAVDEFDPGAGVGGGGGIGTPSRTVSLSVLSPRQPLLGMRRRPLMGDPDDDDEEGDDRVHWGGDSAFSSSLPRADSVMFSPSLPRGDSVVFPASMSRADSVVFPHSLQRGSSAVFPGSMPRGGQLWRDGSRAVSRAMSLVPGSPRSQTQGGLAFGLKLWCVLVMCGLLAVFVPLLNREYFLTF